MYRTKRTFTSTGDEIPTNLDEMFGIKERERQSEQEAWEYEQEEQENEKTPGLKLQ